MRASNDSRPEVWEVAVVGAGAAGLLAAGRAAERGRRTLLLEKNAQPGIKILMSGGTRCNITQGGADPRGVIDAFSLWSRDPNKEKFLYPALKALGPSDVVDLFEAEGVATKIEPTGKVFPVSDRAADVLDALLRRAARLGVRLVREAPVTRLDRTAAGFSLETAAGRFDAAQVILTTGGLSYPRTGSTGDGYAFCRQFGHTIIPPRAALTPITVDAPWVPPLRGITLPDVRVRILDRSQVLAERREALLFTHFGLSGPAVLDISRAVSRSDRPESLILEIDLQPDFSAADLEARLQLKTAATPRRQVVQLLPGPLPHRLRETLLNLCAVPLDRTVATLRKDERRRLVQASKSLRLAVRGVMGFGKAEVTSGGVCLDEVNPRTLESRLCPGLFVAGELLDLDGPVGGYNFQAAWSTGWLAGDSV